MAKKTLVISEKPSVGRDLAKVLPGLFVAHDNFMESDTHVVSWAVGHLLTLAEPEDYDPRYKRWRQAQLPIVPEKFKVKPIDKRSSTQLRVLKQLIARKDVDRVINACDAGREGELIFAYVWQAAAKSAKKGKGLERLWLSSLTKAAIEEAFTKLRPAEEMRPLEDAARSRSEADWLVGINSTRAATLKLKPAFGSVASLGRVQTPTLALLAAREAEIQKFVSEPYWLVEASFNTAADLAYSARFEGGRRLDKKTEAAAVVKACKGRAAEITKLTEKTGSEEPPLLYDLTTLQREANSQFGFTAKRTLAAAQRLYEHHKALTYPRTSSRFLASDMEYQLPDVAKILGAHPEYAKASTYVTGLKKLPVARVINDAKVTDHHAIIPTEAKADLAALGSDELKVYDLVARRFLAAFHPEARFRRTAVETTVDGSDGKGYKFKSQGKVYTDAGWRGVYGTLSEAEAKDDSLPEQELPSLQQGEKVDTKKVESLAKETKPPRRFSDASLLGAMEAAGKDLDDDEAREAMKDLGLGTPATRAQTIERLISVGYVERQSRAIHVTEKGMKLIELLGGHELTSASLTGSWERRLREIERGSEQREAFMADIVDFSTKTVKDLQAIVTPEPSRRNLGPCPHCGKPVIENRKAYSCWQSSDPGCGFVVWKRVAGKELPVEVVRELIATGRTEQPVEGLKSRKGRSFKARLKHEKSPGGKWQVSFDEEWASEPEKVAV